MTSVIQTRWFRSVSLLSAIFGLVAVVGCNLAGHSDDATVRVLLTDAPFPFEMVDSANVTIDRVELVSEGAGVVDVTADWTEPRTFNLLDLRDGVTALLGEVQLSEGTYEQVRLVLAGEAAVVMKEEAGGAEYDLTVPSGSETGIKIPLNSLVVESGSYLSLTLDFDVAESFVVLGEADTPASVEGFNFKPVVKLLSVDFEAAEDETSEQEPAQ